MDMADRKDGDLRRVLLSADCFNDRAISLGSFQVNTPVSRSRASLSRVTLVVQFPEPAVLDLPDTLTRSAETFLLILGSSAE